MLTANQRDILAGVLTFKYMDTVWQLDSQWEMFKSYGEFYETIRKMVEATDIERSEVDALDKS